MAETCEVALSLTKIKEAVVFKALCGGFLQPLSSFLNRMVLEWGEADTAYATLRAGTPLIVLGRTFFATQVKDESEAAEVVLHEIMHHVFRHLHDSALFERLGYSHQTQNLAEDALINAYLAKVGCAGFMKRYYSDERQFAFLRAGSTEFRMPDESGELVAVRFIDPEKEGDFAYFYSSLYALHVKLERSLEFFHEHFPEPQSDGPKLLGGHGEGDGAEGGNTAPTQSGTQPGQKPHQQSGGQSSNGSVISADAANKILQALGAKPVSKKTRSNFAEVIRKISTVLATPGTARVGTRLTRRMPVKLSRQDILNIERGRDLFSRSDYRQRQVNIYFDVSGSVAPYLPFVVGLMRTLKQSEVMVRAFCWADELAEIPFPQLLKGIVPEGLGIGTWGEGVARHIAENHIKQAIIVTDNVAGTIETHVGAQIHLCLMEGSAHEGSFLDRTVVPRCQVHDLKLGSS